MADILLDVKVQGTQEVLKAQGAMSSVTSAAAKLASEMGKGRLTSQAYFKGQTELVKVLTQAGFSYNQAKKAVFDYTKALRDQAAANAAADAAKKLADRNEYLRRTYQQGYAAFARARTQMRELREAMRNGIITTEQYRAAVQRLREEQARQNAQGNRNTRGMGQSSTMIQQAGYQFGDFAVQVQSGTNAFVAFGQQATQLAGTLTLIQGRVPLLGISYLALGTALGVVIPLVTAYLAYTQRASGATKKLKDSLDDLNETNKLLEDFGKNFGKDLIGNIEAVRKAFGDLVADVYEAQIKQVQTKLKSLLGDKAAVQATQIQITDFEGLAPEQLQKQLQQVLFIKEQFARLTATEVTSQSELNALYDDVYQTLKNSGQINESGLAVLRSIAAENGIVLGLMQSQVDEAEEQTTEEEKRLKKLSEIKTAHEESLRTRKQETALNLMMLQFGKDSAAVQNLRNQQEITNLGIKLEALGYTDDQIEAEKEALRTLQNTQDRLAAAAVEGKNLADALREAASAMASLSSFSAGLDKAIAVASAKVQALKTGANEAVAGQIAGLQADLSTRLEAAREAGADRPDLVKIREEGQGKISTLEGLLTEGAGLRKSSSSGSSGGGAAKVQEDYLAKLKLEADRKLELTGLSEEEARIKEITYQLIDKGLPIEQNRINAIVATEEAVRKAAEAEQQREQMMNMVEDNIKNAFMSIVDGSKSVEDAFKSMLRNILLAVYEQQVAQPAATGISNLIGSFISGLGGGSAPTSSLRPKARSFEGGGFTGYGPRSGGLDGRGGMLAMVHPNETVVDHTKGQKTGGNVTVVQNFSFQANGDESIKRIIGQSMPQIAQYTSKTIVDQRRKGGSMKAAFRG